MHRKPIVTTSLIVYGDALLPLGTRRQLQRALSPSSSIFGPLCSFCQVHANIFTIFFNAVDPSFLLVDLLVLYLEVTIED